MAEGRRPRGQTLRSRLARLTCLTA